MDEKLTQKLEGLPAKPGVYLFKDKKGAVLYVGKAKSLRSRVRSYFQASSSDDRQFLPFLQRAMNSQGADLETIVTASEKEAAILESNLVKQHQPRFNVKLRDDKNFISLRLGLDHAWPRLEVVRSAQDDNARYFGPYHSATSARRALGLVNKHFQLRTCGDLELTSRRRPCLQFQIKRCPAPCVFEVDKAWYADQVRAVAMFLDGRHDELSRELVAKMKEAAATARFELAAVYRDQLRAIENVREDQRIVTEDLADRDVVGFYREGDLAELSLLQIREGRLADVTSFSLKKAEIPDEELLSGFLTQLYAERADLPNEIVVPIAFEGKAGFAEWMTERAKRKVQVVLPQRGARVQLLALARENARHAFLEKSRTTDDVQDRLLQLQERLRLPTLPRRIECCDISHLGGGDVVGAVVAMVDGQLDKKHYRTFNVRGPRAEAPSSRNAGNDDYGAMYEVLARRFHRGLSAARTLAVAESTSPDAPPPESAAESAEKKKEAADWELPDLFVVDGGRGQLAVALAAARDLGLHSLPIVALAKERDLFPPKPKLLKKLKPETVTVTDTVTETETETKTETETAAETKTETETETVTETEEAAAETVTVESAPGTVVDRVYLPGQKNPIPLKSHSASLFFLARLRDEAHRFSNRARERLGKARRFKSALDDLPGIGPALKRSLLTTLGSVAAIRAATDEELLKVPGVRPKHLDALRRLGPSSIRSSERTT